MILQDGKAVIHLPAQFDEICHLRDWVEAILDEIFFACRSGQQVLICVDEIAANIVQYAYPSGEGDFLVSVSYDYEKKILKLTFTDHGIPFDPLLHDTPDTSSPLEQRKIGGLGITVVQRMMDHVEYTRTDDCNVLSVVKHSSDGDAKK